VRQDAADRARYAQNMPLRPLDELDDLEELALPAPLPLRRICSTTACRGTARPGGRYCRPCHAVVVRRSRDRHAQQLAIRRRDAGALRDDAIRAADSARAKLAMALRRGTMQRGLCQICGTTDVLGIIEDRSGGGTSCGCVGSTARPSLTAAGMTWPSALLTRSRPPGTTSVHGCWLRWSFFPWINRRSCMRSRREART